MYPKKSILTRYFYILVFFCAASLCIIVKAAMIMFLEKDYWGTVAGRFVTEGKSLPATRGNILSSDGKLLASSLPEYRLYMDFKAPGLKDDTLMTHLNEICAGLHEIIPNVSASEFRNRILEGRKVKSRYYSICPVRISYIQYKSVKELPFFNLGKNASGLTELILNQRKKPFGSLANRTLGDMYADTAQGAKNGLELAFDSLLKGTPGIYHRQKVLSQYINITDAEPVNGCDLVSTIDVDMQDICEKALVDKLKELEAFVGVAVLMEVKTGEVKAIVNMTRGSDGEYYEVRNNAISDMMEPGSTFKTASIMVALEDGYITPDTKVNTGNGQKRMHGSVMKDWNWNKGGYGEIDVTRIMEVSSNVGVSSIIEQYYSSDPEKFVNGLKRMSINEPLNLQIPGEGKPNIKGPKERYFAKTTLPWMSIGYETQIPPINILTFYNAIANDGKMVQPKFVRSAVRDGRTIIEYPTKVINEKICSDKTLSQIREILEKVVSEGLAKPAGCKEFSVAGKTGTAQISQGKGGYTSMGRKYLVSFCGYFPADAPQYSLIVSIQKPNLPASGGTMAGSVFSKIAERVYAQKLRYELNTEKDTIHGMTPQIKQGDLNQTHYVLSKLDVDHRTSAQLTKGNTWGSVIRTDKDELELARTEDSGSGVPNVIGMGAKDALFLLEQSGLKVEMRGTGKVRSQSLPHGSAFQKGQSISLRLQ